MAIFTGEVSHKNGLGRTRQAVATDNTALARAFGISGIAGAKYSNGKVGMLQLVGGASHNEIAIDPNEMTRIPDEADYVRSHLSLVTNYGQLATAISNDHRAELTSLLHQINSSLDFTALSNEDRGLVTKVYFGVASIADVKEKLASQDDDVALLDTLKRNIMPAFYDQNSQVSGIDYNITGRGTPDIHVKRSSRLISVRIKLIGTANGSASTAGSAYKQSFIDIKKAITRVASEDFIRDIRFEKDDDITDIVTNVLTVVRQFIRENVRREIRKINEQFASVSDFNPAGAKSRLWNELGITTTDIPQTNINNDLLRRYSDGELTATQFANLPESAFGERFARANGKRVKQADTDALAQTIVEQTTPNLSADELNAEINKITPLVETVIDQYAEELEADTRFESAYATYQSANSVFEKQIISRVNERLVDSGDREAENIEMYRATWYRKTNDISEPLITQALETALTDLEIPTELYAESHSLFNINATVTRYTEQFVDSVILPAIKNHQFRASRVDDQAIRELLPNQNIDLFVQQQLARVDLIPTLVEKYQDQVIEKMRVELQAQKIIVTNSQIMNELRSSLAGRYNYNILHATNDVSDLVAKTKRALNKISTDMTKDNVDVGLIRSQVRVEIMKQAKVQTEAKNKPDLYHDFVGSVLNDTNIVDETTTELINKSRNKDDLSLNDLNDIEKAYEELQLNNVVSDKVTEAYKAFDLSSQGKLTEDEVRNVVENVFNKNVETAVTNLIAEYHMPKSYYNVWIQLSHIFDLEPQAFEYMRDELMTEIELTEKIIRNAMRQLYNAEKIKAVILDRVKLDMFYDDAFNSLHTALSQTLDQPELLTRAKLNHVLTSGNVSLSDMFSGIDDPTAFLEKYRTVIEPIISYDDETIVQLAVHMEQLRDKILTKVITMNELDERVKDYYNQYFDDVVSVYLNELNNSVKTNAKERKMIKALTDEDIAQIIALRIPNVARDLRNGIEKLQPVLANYYRLQAREHNFNVSVPEAEKTAQQAINKMLLPQVLNASFGNAQHVVDITAGLIDNLENTVQNFDSTRYVTEKVVSRYSDSQQRLFEQFGIQASFTLYREILNQVSRIIMNINANVANDLKEYAKENNLSAISKLNADTYIGKEYPVSSVTQHIKNVTNIESIATDSVDQIKKDFYAQVGRQYGDASRSTAQAYMTSNFKDNQFLAFYHDDSAMQSFIDDHRIELTGE